MKTNYTSDVCTNQEKSQCDDMRPSSCFLLKPNKMVSERSKFFAPNLTQMSRHKVY